MRQAAVRSLERRLWLGLAALVLATLALVSTIVYAMISTHLTNRQQATLHNMTQLVNHLLDEQSLRLGDPDRQAMVARLDDHFSGHADFALSITDASGAVLYETRHAIPAQRVAALDFDIVTPAAGLAGARGRISQDTLADEELLRHLTLALTLATLLGALVAGFGGRVLVRQGIQPVAHLIQQLGALDTSHLGQRLDGSRQPAELQPLVTQINALLTRIDGAYRQLEGFNADVAHELNTPLSTLITSTEVALRKERDAETLRDVLGSNLEELQRMSGMVKDMLFLASVDRGAQARREPVVSLREVVASVVDYHDAVLSERGLQAQIVGDTQGAFDVPLIKRAVSNLLGNAARYASSGSVIRVEISTPGPGTTRLAVVNEGELIAPEHLKQIFDRLYRVERSRSQGDARHGLGLSIVAAVARMHRGAPFAESSAQATRIGLDLAQEPEPNT